MNQSTVIFGFLAAAFFVFITQRGELPIYWGFLVSSPVQPASGPAATPSGALGGNILPNLSGVLGSTGGTAATAGVADASAGASSADLLLLA